MPNITVVTKGVDRGDPFRMEYAGTLINDIFALYVDTTYSLAVLERVYYDGDEYVTTGGPGSIIFDLPISDASIIDNIRDMSAIELLSKFIRKGDT
ncbi:hypothetical protein MKY59_25845 [Paenibacillus sp. FSL W8-0426]|uniref:hypothetical protein n=1 Tax=Paenibacillus sp. FSL W8-0426 TaxID=2921714 RepID=UPI0030D9B707